MTHPNALTPSRSVAIRWLMLIILAWGFLLALGTYLFGKGNLPLLRAAIIAGCTLGFLALWVIALSTQPRAPDSQTPDSRPPTPDP